MGSFTIAEAQEKLPALIDRALAGERVVITRNGEPVVEIAPCIEAPRKRITQEGSEFIRANRIKPPGIREDSATLISRMRDEGEK